MSVKPKTYLLLKLNSLIKSHRIKFFGLWLLHKFNKRYLAVNFDPVNACNLRCKMCYFTDENYVKKLKGTFDKDDLPLWAERILPRALKLQVGCGTEPTLYSHLDQVFELGKAYKVPHISLTTNANLLTKEKLELWVNNGLNEIIVSLHGVHKDTYEFMMGKGDYEKFHNSLQLITDLKEKNTQLSLRINYTFNADNFNELSNFFKVYGKYNIDTIQLRPLRKLGETAYSNFSMNAIFPVYEGLISGFRKETKERNITLIAVDIKEKLIEKKNKESLLFNYTYFYISPTAFWHNDFDWKHETYNQYCKRTKWDREFLKNAFTSKKKLEYLQRDENLNYTID